MDRRSAPGFVGRFTLPFACLGANHLQTDSSAPHGPERTPLDFPPYRSALYGQERTGKHGAIGLITQRS